MKAMEDKIRSEGRILPNRVLNVGQFLNQQVDAVFLKEMGAEIARLFKHSDVDKILTIESSGIAIATAAGIAMEKPVVIAKKSKTANVSGDIYSALVYSFTHNVENHVMVSKEFLPEGTQVLIVDDFLAHGSALNALIDIAKGAGCEVVGCCTAIEKGYQQGGDNLRARGYRIESLAIIEDITDDEIIFR